MSAEIGVAAVPATENVVGDVTKKQGAYGKVKTHSESKLSQLKHVDEVWVVSNFVRAFLYFFIFSLIVH